ncbi:YrhB domain-containing protein [Caldimonas brevitalea]|uniref:YrhB domain-containing protein n=1 Tax=Caldimonas brevitalea TaxID=413882 RepID=UPI003AA8BBCF
MNVAAPPEDCYLIVDAGVIEDQDGWYFPYQSARFIETNDISYSVVGNCPIFVSKCGKTAELRRPPLHLITRVRPRV